EGLRRRDDIVAHALERWLRQLIEDHGDRILPVTLSIAEEWGRLTVPDPLPVIDGLLAATAKVHDLTFATRNIKDVARTGISLFDPFTG
ncbi:MAG TPA: PIN domain-containing protein, partial [Caldimonas sp.]